MEFAPYQVPFAGNGMVIGLNAVIHVLLSHGVAIGMMFLVFLGERHGRTLHGQVTLQAWAKYQKKLVRFTAYVITTMGAITGAGIWITTMGLAPRGIASMLRIFFWAWFAEWLVFTSEALVLLVLYWRWNRLSPTARFRSTGAYAALGGLSAVLITGNLGFMLTPGGWVQEASFWSGFFNPSFAPQVFLRLGIALLLGGLGGVLFALASASEARVRIDAVRLAGRTFFLGATVCAAVAPFYFLVVPRGFVERSLFAVTTSRFSGHPRLFLAANIMAALVLLVTGTLALRRRIKGLRWLIGPALLMAIGLVAEFERVREFIRGPYLMPGYMYANGILVKEAGLLQQGGAVVKTQNSPAESLLTGAQLFAQQCSVCHTASGINDIRQRVAGRTRDGIRVILDHTQGMVSFMPPVCATSRDKDAMADFLWAVSRNQLSWASRARLLPEAENSATSKPR